MPNFCIGWNIALHPTVIDDFHDCTGVVKLPRILTWIFVLTKRSLLESFQISHCLNHCMFHTKTLHILFEYQDLKVFPEEKYKTC